MTRDDLQALHDANPVPYAVGYSNDEAASRVAEIVRSDGAPEVVTWGSPAEPRRAPRWLVPALAAAAVLVLAVVSAIVFTRRDGSDDAAGPGLDHVTCIVSTSDGAAATRDRQKQATEVIKTRVAGLGGRAEKFTSDSTTGSIGFTPRGVRLATAERACAATTTAIRPLVTSVVQVDTTTPRSADPLAALPFPLPTNETAFGRLSPTDQGQLAAALSHYDCSGKLGATDPALVCEGPSGAQLVYLLAGAIVGGADIRSATTVAPNAGRAITQWTVDLQLQRGAAAKIEAFTGAHNAAGASATPTDCRLAAAVSCQDFLAFTADNVVISVPLTVERVSNDIQVAGNLTKASARALAADYTAASIGLRPS